MNKSRNKFIFVILIFALFLNSYALASESRHWVYDELAEFKQHLLPHIDAATKEEWTSVHSTVLSEAKLNEPIKVWDWAILLKMILDPDKGKSGPMLDMYVYGLSSVDKMTREDAVGGLVKLLTLKHISGSSTFEELKDSLLLNDLEAISERQRTLVQMAYCHGILDSQTTYEFRPDSYLTNAEAVSILNRVYNKFLVHKVDLTGKHWAEKVVSDFAEFAAAGDYRSAIIKETLIAQALDKPIKVEQWHDLLLNTLFLHYSKYPQMVEDYTFGLADNGCIRRDKAVAGLVKILHITNHVEGRDARPQELEALMKIFSDAGHAFDQSKLAIAYTEGLIKGYENGSFRPHAFLTNAEALVLVVRVDELYISSGSNRL